MHGCYRLYLGLGERLGFGEGLGGTCRASEEESSSWQCSANEPRLPTPRTSIAQRCWPCCAYLRRGAGRRQWLGAGGGGGWLGAGLRAG